MYNGTDHKQTVPGRSLRGHFGGNLGQLGPFGAHFEAPWKDLGHYGPMSPLLAAKKGFHFPFIRSNRTDYKHTVIVGSLNVHQALFVCFNGFIMVSITHFWAVKWTQIYLE